MHRHVKEDDWHGVLNLVIESLVIEVDCISIDFDGASCIAFGCAIRCAYDSESPYNSVNS